MSAQGTPIPSPQPQIDSFSDLFLRLTWFLFGPLALLGLTLAIAVAGSGWVTWLDLAFVVVVGLTIASRWIELRKGKAMTGTGEPATRADVRRYSQVMTLVAAGVWVACNVYGNHLAG